MATVAALTFFPVKGCAGSTVPRALLTRAGLEHDRTFLVVDDQGTGLTQRKHPRLALITPDISADGTELTLCAPGVEPFRFGVDVESPRCEVRSLGTALRGIDQGDGAAEWLGDALGVSCRVVRIPPENDRVTDGLVTGTSAFADSCAVHVLSSASHTLLTERLAERGVEPVAMHRFRPNIVVTGWEPHAEDRARTLRIGETEIAYAKLADRCVVTTVDPETGRKRGPEPLSTLATYRRSRAQSLAFGAKFAVLGTGKLAVGDEVTVTEWGDSEF
ncbi:MOSC domain-containing protein [Allosaccharopolyspora coralli]|uniref:MOSC domain-containing protein n=1 Tax=Allosaccharopolyspora coralli TaxID=2665642 RepID=A0A5Q3Q410_9PSEU|nr:MOSC N-terminal beta barrel domain-containing protein [Allosaccharopolyspora coralli]QGK68560.1 MOSC domain-containing protein [Allosaccharopolyspora coralli]